MQFIFSKKESEILEQIEKRLEKKYLLDWRTDGMLIHVKGNIKLHITFDTSSYDTSHLLLSIQDKEPIKMRLDDLKEHEYLDLLEEIIENLKRQINLFLDFAINFVKNSDFDDEYSDVDPQCLIDIDSCQLLIKGCNTVILYSTFDLFNEDEHIQININDIYGNYPIIRRSTIKPEDLKKVVDFYLNK